MVPSPSFDAAFRMNDQKMDDLRRERLHRQTRRARGEGSRLSPRSWPAATPSRSSRSRVNWALNARVFDLADPAVVATNLEDVTAVLHCAGPFSATSRPMLAGCLRAKTHYLDITGEIAVFEDIHSRSEEFRNAGIVVVPGVGFDVVPTDCLAAMLKRELPSATHLKLAFKPRDGKLSPGTTKTMIEGLPEGGRIRRDGRIVKVPAAYKIETIPFTEDLSATAVTIPWGDVSTAYYSTGIPNIEVFSACRNSRSRE